MERRRYLGNSCEGRSHCWVFCTCSGVPSASLQSSDGGKKTTLVVPFPLTPSPPLSTLFSSRRLQLWLREILEQLTKRLWTTAVNILLRSGRTMGRKTPYTGFDWINRVIYLISWQTICSYFQKQFIHLFIYSYAVDALNFHKSGLFLLLTCQSRKCSIQEEVREGPVYQ